MKNTNNTIDVIKFIFAFLVIIIHVEPFAQISHLSNVITVLWLARLAVPFYFMSAGFFFYQKLIKNNFSKSDVKQYIYRLLLLYFLWSIINLPFTFFLDNYINNKDFVRESLKLIRNIFFFGSVYHLWFFTALIFSVFFFYTFVRKIGILRLLILSFFLHLICIFTDSYNSIIQNTQYYFIVVKYRQVFVTTVNGLFFGLLYFTMGASFNIFRITLNKLQNAIALTLVLCLNLAEVLLINKYLLAEKFNVTFLLIPSSYLLFNQILNTNLNLNFKFNFPLREYSTLIYCFHILPLFFFKMILGNNLYLFLIVSVLSIIAAILIQRSNWKILKYLY